ncbi:pentatricopeptide repeat-containing protein At4g14170 [Elaeis guineensis]|uniref:Pentatricopeptide repeat-containing protein At4g14170 n=1 Tax=Elaeis guineensis var. tenera TaxID=51953 RepID=A0A6I9QGS0_ELAGV|nr:pentatricopeptide repeat-containing protein At4g14170 [Elaeis guineensis]
MFQKVWIKYCHYHHLTKRCHNTITTTPHQPNSNLHSLYFHFLHSSPSLHHLCHLHARLLRTGLYTDAILSTKLLLTYSQRYCLLPTALSIFLHMPCRTSYSWNILITELARFGLPHKSMDFFLRMQSSSIPVDEFTLPPVLRSCALLGSSPASMSVHALAVKLGLDHNLYVGSALVLCYNGLSEISLARKLFDEMPERDAALWTSMLSVYAQSGEPELALGFFREMVSEGIQLDGVVMVSLLLACGQLGWLRHGRSVHGCSIRRFLGLPLSLGNALIDMYVKCGAFGYAETVFSMMPATDVISWSALILGHGLNGHASAALKLFDEMSEEGMEPNSVTFLGVLSACAHAGMVEKAWAFFDRMKQCGIEPELKHYACMADALGRAGQLVEAEMFIEAMPMVPDEAVLGALLAGCRMHGNVEMGERVSRRLMGMSPSKSGYYMSLANMYVDAGRFVDAEIVREFMKQKNVGKLPGCSLIELDFPSLSTLE